MPTIAEIKDRVDIHSVWFALGGGKLRYSRGQAFWRNGDAWSVALDVNRNIWFDHVAGVGGDVVELVRTVRQCGFRDAADWLAAHAGIPVTSPRQRSEEIDSGWTEDLRRATWWKIAARILAEWALEELSPVDPERRVHTRLLATIRLGEAALVAEYRDWRRRDPRMTAGMVYAGRLHDARMQRRLALWIRSTYVQAA
jgi:hypothetical protein